MNCCRINMSTSSTYEHSSVENQAAFRHNNLYMSKLQTIPIQEGQFDSILKPKMIMREKNDFR